MVGACVCVCVYGLLSSAAALELLLDTVLLRRLLCLVPNILTSQAAVCVFCMFE